MLPNEVRKLQNIQRSKTTNLRGVQMNKQFPPKMTICQKKPYECPYQFMYHDYVDGVLRIFCTIEKPQLKPCIKERCDKYEHSKNRRRCKDE
jgi:hypothetical protein